VLPATRSTLTATTHVLFSLPGPTRQAPRRCTR